MFTNTNWRGYRYATWTGLALIGAIMIWEATQAQWRYAATMAGFGAMPQRWPASAPWPCYSW